MSYLTIHRAGELIKYSDNSPEGSFQNILTIQNKEKEGYSPSSSFSFFFFALAFSALAFFSAFSFSLAITLSS